MEPLKYFLSIILPHSDIQSARYSLLRLENIVEVSIVHYLDMECYDDNFNLIGRYARCVFVISYFTPFSVNNLTEATKLIKKIVYKGDSWETAQKAFNCARKSKTL